MRRHALLVGIDEYLLLPAEKQLSSCVRDVELMEPVLVDRFGFAAADCIRLTNREATRKALLTALEDLAARVQPDDVVVVHFSGHGSRRPAPVWSERRGLMEETLVPSDSGRDTHPNRDIPSHQLYDWLLRTTAATPYVTLILDSCYSGTAFRDPQAAQTRWVEEDPRQPVEAEAEEIQRSSSPAVFRDLGPSGWLPLSDRYVLLAACRARESAYVYSHRGGAQYGALTWFLCRELQQAEAAATWRDVLDPLRRAVNTRFPMQTPQLEGSLDREIFGLCEIAPERFLPVLRRAGERVVLGGGEIHGLTRGSEWDVYPPGTKRFGDGAARQGRARLAVVSTVEAEAELVEEALPGSVQTGARAVERVHGCATEPLAVTVRGPDAQRELLAALEAKIGASPRLRLAPAEEGGPLGVTLVPARDQASAGDPVPQLGPVSEPQWAVTDAGGELLCRPWPVYEAERVARVVETLERRASYLATLELAPPVGSDPLKAALEVQLLRCRPGGSSVEATAGPEGVAVYDEGDRLGFSVTHRHCEPLYLYVLDLGLGGGVELIYPVAGAHEALPAGVLLRYGERSGEELVVSVPEGHPARQGPFAGTEYLKVFAATCETDLGWLEQKAVRRVGSGGVLERLLAQALAGEPMRDGVPMEAEAEELWTVVTKSFLVRRKADGGRRANRKRT